MPRNRILQHTEAMRIVNEVWPVGQTEIVASELRQVLESTGNADIVDNIRNLKAGGYLRGYIRQNSDGTTSHMITKGERA
jgi:hypothetical protein